MNNRFFSFAGLSAGALGVLLLAPGCGTDGGAATEHNGSEDTQAQAAAASDELPADIAKILKDKCSLCHDADPSFGAPMGLTKASDFQAEAVIAGGKVLDVTKTRINATDPRRAMPPASSKQLTAEEKAAFNAWLDKGAPAAGASTTTPPATGADAGTTTPPATGADAGAAVPTTPEGVVRDGSEQINRDGLECYNFTAHNGDLKTPYAVGAAKDAYFNFTFKAPWQGMAYGVIFRPIVDNKQVIHHWLLFQDTPAGKPGPAVPSIGAHPQGQLLAGWAPGGETLNLREQVKEEVGIELPDTSTYTVEFHYNSSDASAKDASGVEVCVQKKKPANIAGLSWLGYDQLAIPAQKWTGTCRPKAQQEITILGVTPHMHKQGRHMKTTINRKSGQKEILHDADFDFDYQRQYMKTVKIQPGDTLTTECTFGKAMAFGESTTAEMCYNFTLAYPKGALSDGGAWGTLAHGGGACLGQ